MMTNVYHGEIVRLLMYCGQEGMRVSDISRFIYNQHVGFFNQDLNFDMLHQTLRCYLWRQSGLRRSPFRRVRYGVYGLKKDMAIQLDFCFDRPAQQDEDEMNLTTREVEKKITPENDPRQLLLFPE